MARSRCPRSPGVGRCREPRRDATGTTRLLRVGTCSVEWRSPYVQIFARSTRRNPSWRAHPAETRRTSPTGAASSSRAVAQRPRSPPGEGVSLAERQGEGLHSGRAPVRQMAERGRQAVRGGMVMLTLRCAASWATEGDELGEITASIELENPGDRDHFERGQGQESDVRRAGSEANEKRCLSADHMRLDVSVSPQ